MRLYLSSMNLGNYTDELQRLAGEHARVAVISNAGDATPDEERIERTSKVLDGLRALDFEPTDIDLRNYFGNQFTDNDLYGYDLVWVRGGNVFTLRKAMRESGFDTVITRALGKDAIAYGGYSAGVCVLAPSLHGIELCDPVDEVPIGYPKETDWSGLNILQYAIAPHYKSDHPESSMIDNVVEYFDAQSIPFQTLSDGEVIIVNGNNTEKLT